MVIIAARHPDTMGDIGTIRELLDDGIKSSSPLELMKTWCARSVMVSGARN